MLILLAEDDKNFGYVLKNELESRGHEVDLVGDGVEAILKSMDRPYDFVLLDIRMPKLDGLCALRIIKKTSTHTPVILFTGHGTGVEEADAIAAGAICYLSKPFSINNLTAEIERLGRDRVLKG